ncbi:MAG: hypothetical protein JW937_05210 [Candidatus Omnitrophica bacterium]|nr:hypothetical protein [Candidatus Omnitrophota bacterium]
MKIIDIHRHSLVGEDRRISPKGVEVVQAAQYLLPLDYQLYYVSPAPRCADTLRTLGQVTFEEDDAFSGIPGAPLIPYLPQLQEYVNFKGCSTLEAYMHFHETSAIVWETGRRVLDALLKIASALPEDGRALVISHSGAIEPAALIALGSRDAQDMGGQLGPCEGVRFEIEGGLVSRVVVRRLQPVE